MQGDVLLQQVLGMLLLQQGEVAQRSWGSEHC
jgi:hypothetical protein